MRRAGRLKILLGAAPGVGKTFAMLSEAQRRRRAGVDVVCRDRRNARPARHRCLARRARGHRAQADRL
ncbi:MAG: hypothetical protein WDN69_16695 [Aliidongia sp.]